MQSISVAEFQENFTSILKNVQENKEKVILEFGKEHQKIAILSPYEEEVKPKKRKLGILQGKGSFEIVGKWEMTPEELFDE